MANLHKLSVQEALNAQGAGGNWTVNTVGTAAVTGGTAINLDISGAHQLGVFTSVDINFNFSAADSGTVSATNDLVLPHSTLTFITVPRGLGETIFFNYVATSTRTGTVKTVEV